MRLILAMAGGAVICAACSQPAPETPETPPDAALETARLESPPPGPQPGVTIEADPAPPYDYWAPAGSVIRNIPNAPGGWYAEINGEPGPAYNGDDCGASRLQGLVGRSDVRGDELSAPGGVNDYALGDVILSDLRGARLNIQRDTPGGPIQSVFCG